jgi:uncharacterized protein (TIGR03000 family)
MSSTLSLGRFRFACLVFLLTVASARAEGPDRPTKLVIYLPPDAILTVDGVVTKQTGTERRFRTPPLQAGKKYYYSFRWTFSEDDRSVTIEKKINFSAGEDKVVDLRGEKEKIEPDVPFVPTPPEMVDKMLEMASIVEESVVYDLGSGDGRIVIAAAKKYKCKAVGFEIDPKLVKESRENVKKAGVEKLVTIEEKNIFKVDLKPASVVTLYLFPEVNVKLIPQLEKMKEGSRIVSYEFAMKGMKPKNVETVKDKDGNEHKIYLWVIPFEKEKE